MAFAEKVDELVKEILEKLKIEEMFEKANPMLKAIGQEASTMQIRNAIYLCAKHRESETLDFLLWLNSRIAGIVDEYGYGS